MKTFIIHYTRLTQRKKLVDDQVAQHDLDAEIITSYDKDDLSPEDINCFYQKNPHIYESKVAPLWNSNEFKYRELNLPEISCAIKHFEAIKKCSQSKHDYSLILEDDAVLCSDFSVKLEALLAETPSDWDAVFIGSGCGEWFQKYKLSQSKQVTNNCFLVNHPATNCAEGYLLKKETAAKIYKKSIPFHLAGDWEIAYQLYKCNAQVYWRYPSLIDQGSKNGMFESALDLGQRG